MKTIKTITRAISTICTINANDTLAALLTETNAYLAVEMTEEECGGYRFSGVARLYFAGIDGCIEAAVCCQQADAEDMGDNAGITIEAGEVAELIARRAIAIDTLRRLAAASIARGDEVCED